MEKIDQTVVRGKTEGGKFAAFSIHVDRTKLFSEYGMEYIRKTVKLLLVKALVQHEDPEVMDAKIKEVLLGCVSKAAYGLALQELRRIMDGGVDVVHSVVREVMEGGDDE